MYAKIEKTGLARRLYLSSAPLIYLFIYFPLPAIQ